MRGAGVSLVSRRYSWYAGRRYGLSCVQVSPASAVGQQKEKPRGSGFRNIHVAPNALWKPARIPPMSNARSPTKSISPRKRSPARQLKLHWLDRRCKALKRTASARQPTVRSAVQHAIADRFGARRARATTFVSSEGIPAHSRCLMSYGAFTDKKHQPTKRRFRGHRLPDCCLARTHPVHPRRTIRLTRI